MSASDLKQQLDVDLSPTRLPGSTITIFVAEVKMAGPGEIDISSTDEGGQEIRGSYRVAAGVIHVTLPDGTSTETQLGPNDQLRRWLRHFCRSFTSKNVT